MERIGQAYLRKKKLTPTDPILYEAYNQRTIPFNQTYNKASQILTSIGYIRFNGEQLAKATKDILGKLTLNGTCMISCDDPAGRAPGHMVALIDHGKMPNGIRNIEFFDSTGFEKYRGVSPVDLVSQGIGNIIAITNMISGLQNTQIVSFSPPIEYLREQAISIQTGKNPTCALQSLFRIMNRNLSPQKYYDALFKQSRGANYDAYMYQMIIDIHEAMFKVLNGKSYDVDFLDHKAVPYSTLLQILDGNDDQVQKIRDKEAQYYGEEWADRQQRMDALNFQYYYDWAANRLEKAVVLKNIGIITEGMKNHLEQKVIDADQIREELVLAEDIQRATEQEEQDLEDDLLFQIEINRREDVINRMQELQVLIPIPEQVRRGYGYELPPPPPAPPAPAPDNLELLRRGLGL
jgi:hypothetical protein